jgi:phenylalanine-4-hydroxylase
MFNVLCREDEVPQLQDISDALKQATGWQVGLCGVL